MGEDNKDLEDVIREETSRGRRRIDTKARRERAERLEDIRRLLEDATEQEFVEAITAAGLQPGSFQFRQALQIWRAGRRP